MRARWRWMSLALVLAALLAGLALWMPACGDGGPCVEYEYTCFGKEVAQCRDGQWETLYECNDRTQCCLIEGMATCLVACEYY